MTKLRKLFTTKQFFASGRTRGELRAAELRLECRQIIRGVYGEGPDDPTPLDIARAELLRRGVPAGGVIAGRVYGLDAKDDMDLPEIGRHRGFGLGHEPQEVDGAPVVSPLQTMVDLATSTTVNEWEQVNESALRLGLLTPVPGG